MLVAVLCTGLIACAGAGSAAAQGTGGASVPQVIPETTGGTGYGDSGLPSLIVHPIATVGKRLVARGTLPDAARRRIVLQWYDRKRGWRNAARGRVRSTERFKLRWRPERSGPIKLRVVVRRSGTRAASSSGHEPRAAVTVYRRSLATYYGPGFFGRQTACGQTLTPELHGVAHKRVRCGTDVAITYKGREIVVPVIDRGPFNGDYSWDLTQATADALGFDGAGRIGYARVRSR